MHQKKRANLTEDIHIQKSTYELELVPGTDFFQKNKQTKILASKIFSTGKKCENKELINSCLE